MTIEVFNKKQFGLQNASILKNKSFTQTLVYFLQDDIRGVETFFKVRKIAESFGQFFIVIF